MTFTKDNAGPEGQSGRDAQTAWYEHGIFLAADYIAAHFVKHPAKPGTLPSYEAYPRKTWLHNTVGSGVAAMLTNGSRGPVASKLNDMLADGDMAPAPSIDPATQKELAESGVRTLFVRRRAQLNVAVLERFAAMMGPPQNPVASPDDLEFVLKYDAEIDPLLPAKQPWRSPFKDGR